MNAIAGTARLANLPVSELRTTLDDFLAPVVGNHPDERLPRAATLAVGTITSSRTPVAQMDRPVSPADGDV